MFVAVVCAVAAGCGSGSTGETSSAAVITKAQSIAGTEGKLLQSRILVQDGGTGPVRTMTMVIACKPDGGCEVVAPDGVSYPDLQSFVDDTKLLEPGDHVLGAANMTSPGEKVRSQEFVKSGGLSWGWYAGGAGVLVVVVLAAWWLVLRVRRRRLDDRLQQATEPPTDDE